MFDLSYKKNMLSEQKEEKWFLYNKILLSAEKYPIKTFKNTLPHKAPRTELCPLSKLIYLRNFLNIQQLSSAQNDFQGDFEL